MLVFMIKKNFIFFSVNFIFIIFIIIKKFKHKNIIKNNFEYKNMEGILNSTEKAVEEPISQECNLKSDKKTKICDNEDILENIEIPKELIE